MSDYSFADYPDGANLPERLRSLIERELEEAEEIRWSGQPAPRLFARRSLPIVLFGIPLYGVRRILDGRRGWIQGPQFQSGLRLFSAVWDSIRLDRIRDAELALVDVAKITPTAYVITDRRAIIFEGGFGTTNIRSFRGEQLGDLRRKERDDGFGDLIFDRKVSHDSDGRSQYTDIGFLAIPDVKAVEELVRGIVGRK